MSVAWDPDLPPDDLVTLLDHAVDVIAVVDVAGRLAYVNETVTAVLEWEPRDLIGRPALSLIHPDDAFVAGSVLAAELDGSAEQSSIEVRIRARDRTYLWFEVLAGGWIDAPGLQGLVINLRESTGRHHLAERAARRAELDGLVFDVSRRALDATLADVKEALPAVLSQLGQLLRARRVDVVLFDTTTGVGVNAVAWPANDEAAGRVSGGTIALERIPTVLVGLLRGELLLERDSEWPLPTWATEWYGGAEPAAGAAMLCPLTVQGRLLGVLAVEQDALAEEWAHDEATAIRSVAEALAVALARDHDRRALLASEEQFRLMAEHAGDVITLLDAEGLCRYASTSARTVLGMDPDRMIGADLFDHVHPDDRADARERLAAFVAGQESAVAITYRWLRPSGDVVWIENVCRAVRDPDTRILTGIQGSARDVTAYKIREDELTHRALHDPLTGAANRTLFDQRLSAAQRAQRRSAAPFAVLAIDLDGFKEVNDAHGHLEGDRALVEVAGRLAANVRQADTVGRVGGDEFMVLCRDASADDALALAERLVVALSQPVAVAGGKAEMSASIGVAPADGTQVSIEALLGAADRAMYDAKRSGKGCVRLRRVD
jgi:diguanylate cyclase (GGDEF)-like protein/PAS domain S-box-containing protein